MDEDLEAKQFDLLMLRLQLDLLRHERSFTRWSDDVRQIAGPQSCRVILPSVVEKKKPSSCGRLPVRIFTFRYGLTSGKEFWLRFEARRHADIMSAHRTRDPSFSRTSPITQSTHAAENTKLPYLRAWESKAFSSTWPGGIWHLSCLSLTGENDDENTLRSGIDWGHKRAWVFAGDAWRICLAVAGRPER